jgi:hypothetical protein
MLVPNHTESTLHDPNSQSHNSLYRIIEGTGKNVFQEQKQSNMHHLRGRDTLFRKLSITPGKMISYSTPE